MLHNILIKSLKRRRKRCFRRNRCRRRIRGNRRRLDIQIDRSSGNGSRLEIQIHGSLGTAKMTMRQRRGSLLRGPGRESHRLVKSLCGGKVGSLGLILVGGSGKGQPHIVRINIAVTRRLGGIHIIIPPVVTLVRRRKRGSGLPRRGRREPHTLIHGLGGGKMRRLGRLILFPLHCWHH